MLPIRNKNEDGPHLIYRIPYEFINEFTDAPYEAMRDLLAIPAIVKNALFRNPRVLEERPDRTRVDPVIEENLYKWINYKVDAPTAFNIFNEHLEKPDNHAAYFMHIDLALTEDATGVSMVHRNPANGRFVLDFIFAVESLKCTDKRIPIGKMKFLAIYLKYNLGYNISKVTYDGFQSAESIQELIDNGIDARIQSVDRTPAPYDTLRDLIESDQLSFYDYQSELIPGMDKPNRALVRELSNLTKDSKTGKVDHIAKGSKDLSDALCGAVFTCAAEDFEYRGINDFDLERESQQLDSSDNDYDGIEDSFSIGDIHNKMIEDQMDKDEDKFQENNEFYGEDF